jgi:hypothetical protein
MIEKQWKDKGTEDNEKEDNKKSNLAAHFESPLFHPITIFLPTVLLNFPSPPSFPFVF